jgi:UDP-glucose 4-epimerase
MSERILVTGGAGFIGSHTVDLALARGYEVRVLDNLSQGSRQWLHPDAEFIEGDIADLAVCRKATNDCAGILHLAAMSRSAASLDNVEICTLNNIIGTQNVLTAAKENNVRKLVYAGSSTFYGNQPPPHREDMRPDYLNFYGLTKHVGEEMCLLFDRMYDVPSLVLRYFNVYGPRSSGTGVYALVIPIFLGQLKANKPLTIHGRGNQSRDFVHVRDVAVANLSAYESKMRGNVYNVGTGVPVSVKELADLISLNQVFLPRRGGDAEVTQADVSRIKKELGWSPRVSLAEGLRELMAEELCK